MRYLEDSYLKEHTTRVSDCIDDFHIIIHDSIFYPQGGGQPSDKGYLEARHIRYNVISVSKSSTGTLFEVDKAGLKLHDEVNEVIDWPHRNALMKAHTASHILSSVMHNDHSALITGNQLSTEGFRIDFNIESFDIELITEALRKTNALIQQNLDVSITYCSKDQVLQDPSLCKLAKGLPEHIDLLRIVSIHSDDVLVDRQADGGTHVRNSSEIGLLTFRKAENKGKMNRRVYISLTNK